MPAQKTAAKRPGTITFLAIIAYIVGFFNVLGGFVLLTASNQVDWLMPEYLNKKDLLLGAGIIWLALGVLQMILGYLLYEGKRYAQIFYAILVGVSLAMASWSLFALKAEARLPAITSIIFSGIALYLLFNQRATDYFDKMSK